MRRETRYFSRGLNKKTVLVFFNRKYNNEYRNNKCVNCFKNDQILYFLHIQKLKKNVFVVATSKILKIGFLILLLFDERNTK
jgi:hypothetical protein